MVCICVRYKAIAGEAMFDTRQEHSEWPHRTVSWQAGNRDQAIGWLQVSGSRLIGSLKLIAGATQKYQQTVVVQPL